VPLLFAQILSLTDEGIWLDAASRLLNGKLIYRDFFEFHPPVGFLIVAGWLKAFGENFASARALAIVTLAAITTLTLLASFAASRWAIASLLLPLTWLLQAQTYLQVVINHHLFTTLFSVAGLAVLLDGDEHASLSRWRWLTAGAFLGTSAMITPTRGAYAILASALLILYEKTRFKPLVWFVVGCALCPLAAVAWLTSVGALEDAFQDVIVWTYFNYSGIQWVPYASPIGPFSQIGLAYLVILALSFVNVSLRKSPVIPRNAATCIGFAAAGMLALYPRPDAGHILLTLPMALPLAARNLSIIAVLAKGARPPGHTRNRPSFYLGCRVI
jgi:hypothetical protein